jgi:hypothetical protein
MKPEYGGEIRAGALSIGAFERSRPRGGRYAYRSVEHFHLRWRIVWVKEVPVTQLRKQMLEELQRRNYSQTTVNND